MVLRFASQKLLNLYFKCLILHLIKYIQRNKESKEKRSVSLFVRMTKTEKMCFGSAWYVNMWFVGCAAVINVSTWDMPDNIFNSTSLLWYFPQETFIFWIPAMIRLNQSIWRELSQNFLQQNNQVCFAFCSFCWLKYRFLYSIWMNE